MSHRFNWYEFRRDLAAFVGREVTEAEARQVRRDLTAHSTIQEQLCSEDMSDARRARVDARERGVERRLTEFFGSTLGRFDGDPRGYTVKLNDPHTCGLYEASCTYAQHRFTYFARDWGGSYGFNGGR